MLRIAGPFVLLLVLCFPVFSQTNETLFPEGYFSDPVVTPYGIVTTNERHSSIYVINNGDIEELVSAPGAGRFLHFNKEKSKIGFKLINPPDETQIPAILDLSSKNIIKLENPVKRAGQVSFADDGSVAYVIDTQLIVRREDRVETYNLDVYSNVSPISPDGRSVAFKDYSDQLWIFNLDTQERFQFTDPDKGYRGVQWSPKSNKLVYSTIGTELYYYDLDQRQSVYIGEGESPNWSASGDKIVFHKREIDFLNIELLSSNLFLYEVESQTKKQLTDTDDIFEMDARFSVSDEEIIYHTYDKREIKFLLLNDREEDIGLFKEAPAIKLDRPLEMTEFQLGKTTAQDTVIAGDIDWVHIHQVYDTRSDWNQGRVCCGAATVAQVFATYEIFTPWPLQTYSRTSDFGLYISDPYTWNYMTYTGYTGRWPSGAHGFLWHGGGSPRSRSVQYILNHGISETRRDLDVSWNTVTTEIGRGHSYILCSTGLTAGHIVLAIGTYGDQKTVVVNDPYGDKNAGSYGYQYNGKHALYDWADANTGRQKVTPIAWGVRIRFDPEEEPAVLSFAPAKGDTVHATSNVKITFSQPMEREAFANAFRITPDVAGKITWSDYNRTVAFTPDETFASSTMYSVEIDTSAKNIFGINLPETLEFGFTTKDRDRLTVEKMYPLNNQAGISTTVQFRFRFDAAIARGTLIGNVALYNDREERTNLTNIIVKQIDGRGYLAFEPSSELNHNQKYRLFLYGALRDVNGYPMRDTLIIAFHTNVEQYVNGTILDDFSDIENWKLLSTEEGSSNVNMSVTKFISTYARKVSETNAAKLEYQFTEEDGVVLISNLSATTIHPDQSGNFGLWTYGDLSGNIVEFHFRKNEMETISIIADTLNYTGWKLVTTDMAALSSTDSLEFKGIAVRRTAGGEPEGEIFFDQLQKDIVTPVREQNGNSALTKFSLHQNYPNPFNASTKIRYDIPHESRVRLTVFNVLGQSVAILVNTTHKPGTYETVFDASHLPTGLYIYRLQAGNFVETKSLLFLK